jgi:DNA-binding transcriptional MerR regulator
MNDYITISELAKLMNVSVHQLRYFEDKRILPPAFTGDNHYRMYGIDEVYRLAHILLLRELDIPVGTIEQCLNGYSPEDYRLLLDESLGKVRTEIDRLTKLQRQMESLLDKQREWSEQPRGYQRRWLPERRLKQWLVLADGASLTARSLYEREPAPSGLYKNDLYYVCEAQRTLLCMESAEKTERVLEEGEYLCKPFALTDEQDLEREAERLAHELRQRHASAAGPFIFIEHAYLSMFEQERLQYEIQVRLDPDRCGELR